MLFGGLPNKTEQTEQRILNSAISRTYVVLSKTEQTEQGQILSLCSVCGGFLEPHTEREMAPNRKRTRKMGGASKHASSKHKRKEHRLAEKALARDGSARLDEAAKKREASEAAARKAKAG
jgi:hypothetical protein